MSTATNAKPKHIVIVGGGFAGLYAARELGKSGYQVTLFDKRNFQLFQPLLYQVATGMLTVGDISTQQRVVLSKYKNIRTLMSTVFDIDPANKTLRHEHGQTSYDILLAATGVKHQYFGNDHWQAHAQGLKTVEHALTIRHEIFRAFEQAEQEPDPERRQRLMTFVLVGGGPTGVELAGALGELAHRTMVQDYRAINSKDARIILVEGTDNVLPAYDHSLRNKASQYLEELGVELRVSTMVTNITEGEVTLKCGDKEERIQAETILWAAGVKASAFGQILAERTQAETDRVGRLVVNKDLSLPKHPDIFVLGDLALYEISAGKQLPGLAPVAIQQGRYVGQTLKRREQGKAPKAFKYRDKGSMAIIGRYRVVGKVGNMEVKGFFAWFTWALVHIWSLIEPEQRLSVALQWIWRYFGRTADRLITGNPPQTAALQKQHGVKPKA